MPNDTNILPRDPGGWVVVNGDAVEVMRRLPDAYIDAMMTDRPYAPPTPARSRSGVAGASRSSTSSGTSRCRSTGSPRPPAS